VTTPTGRPNILFITCDQWRGDCVSAAGHAVVRTPNVDALASEGVLFRRHFAGAAPCSPARACIYTGLYQMNNRVCRNGTPLDDRHWTVAKGARALGYNPTLFGYTDVAPDPRLHAPTDPVLRTYEGVLRGMTARQLLPEHQKQWLSWLAQRGIDGSAGFPDIHRPLGDDIRDAPIYGADETPTAFMTGEFLRWLQEQRGEAPWFAHVSFISPHPPFAAPNPFNRLYDAEAGPGFVRQRRWEDEAASHPYLALELDKQDLSKFLPGRQGKIRALDERTMRAIRALYWGMVSEVDSQLGRIWAGIKAAGQWDDTVVVLTSDHAEMMGDHFMLGKGAFFDASYHIPLVIRDPRRRQANGAIVDRYTEAVDIAPTIMDLAGSAPPAWLDGHSLRPFLEDKAGPKDWRDAAHWEFDFRSVSKSTAERHFGLGMRDCNLAVLRTDRFKYVQFGGGLPPLLYDLADDPHETVNVANDPARRALRLEAAERMLSWRSRHLDQSLAMAELTEQGAIGTWNVS
jgi:arylsulfatase A-like enzyme